MLETGVRHPFLDCQLGMLYSFPFPTRSMAANLAQYGLYFILSMAALLLFE